jgi:hypothetical protein
LFFADLNCGLFKAADFDLAPPMVARLKLDGKMAGHGSGRFDGEIDFEMKGISGALKQVDRTSGTIEKLLFGGLIRGEKRAGNCKENCSG